MRHDPIASEDHLLKMYYDARRKVIYEWSGDFEQDIGNLNRQVIEYAEQRGLDYPFYVEGV
jgi:hypothetical protein